MEGSGWWYITWQLAFTRARVEVTWPLKGWPEADTASRPALSHGWSKSQGLPRHKGRWNRLRLFHLLCCYSHLSLEEASKNWQPSLIQSEALFNLSNAMVVIMYWWVRDNSVLWKKRRKLARIDCEAQGWLLTLNNNFYGRTITMSV